MRILERWKNKAAFAAFFVCKFKLEAKLRLYLALFETICCGIISREIENTKIMSIIHKQENVFLRGILV